MKKRVADIIFEILNEYDVTDCFAVVGGGAMHLDNALYKNKNIHTIFNHHEQACSMAAEAYARLSGRMAVVCVTSGPGATNAITGVMGAWQDSLPMIVLSGQVRYAISVPQSGLKLRYRGMQEFEIIPTVKNMTKYAVQIIDPLDIKRELIKAINIAMDGRRGPVWLDIPLDIQSAVVDEDELYDYVVENKIVEKEDENIKIYKDLREIFDNAKRPLILAGNGIVNSGNLELFRSFAFKSGIPVVAAAIAADVMYDEYRLFYGMSGSIGPRTGNFILQNADCILTLGTSLGFKTTGYAQESFAPNAKIIMVDVDKFEHLKPGVRVDYFIESDLKDFLSNMKDYFEDYKVEEEWINYCDDLKKRFTPFETAIGVDENERVCSYRFWQEYMKYEPDDSITILGNNTANSAKLQIGITKENQRIIANNNCGSMGADLPEAIGAAVVSGKEVICSTGDGSIMMNLQELQTIKHNNLPVKIIVFSNDGYNAMRQTYKNFFDGKGIGCSSDTGVGFPDFKDVAQTFGFEYMNCKTNSQLSDVLNTFFKAKDRVLLEVFERLDDPILPRVQSRINEKGEFETPALEDMYPFIDKEEHDKLMLH